MRSGLGTGLKSLLPLSIDPIPQTNKIQGVGKYTPPLVGGAVKAHCKGEWERGKAENHGMIGVYAPVLMDITSFRSSQGGVGGGDAEVTRLGRARSTTLCVLLGA